MKTSKRWGPGGIWGGAILVFLAGSLVHAASVAYVDYDDGNSNNGVHDANIRDGDFGGQTAYNPGGTVPPVELPWVDIGTEASRFRTDKNSGVGSNLNYVIALNRSIALDTGYTVVSGDNSFSVSYQWRDASGWDDNADRVKLTLYYTTDDQPDGTATDLYTLTSSDSQSDSSYQTESYSGVFDDQGGAGKKLFLRLYTDSQASEFARVDNIYFAAVPEPPARVFLVTLLGAAALWSGRRRFGAKSAP